METKFLTVRDVIQRLEVIYYATHSKAFCDCTPDYEKRLAEIISIYNSTGHDIWPALAEFECLDKDHRHYANPLAAFNGYALYVLRKHDYFKPAKPRVKKAKPTQPKGEAEPKVKLIGPVQEQQSEADTIYAHGMGIIW